MEKRVILLWTFSALSWGTVIIGGLIYAQNRWESHRSWLLPVIAVLAVIYAVNVVIMPTWRYLVHRWEVTDEAVYSLKGWLTREWRITPISRIQSIDTTSGPLQRLMGLATLKVTTASKEGTITFDGLRIDVAETVARRLTAVTQATPGDAT